ncbi:lamin tail domain-containing protein [Fibrobacter sp. UWR2]|uniref:lamin tail domain-containing protein n=1 Tax=Fibrobacter sp. UWR2 TaxID=1964352 RepID=UPI000B52302F|nr:lamin tail domain-containing protein [Fibrobacter sp. UWR2]OWV00123.1 hypothetical protein B7994_08640 [Fibrobacter sp. UWR2]
MSPAFKKKAKALAVAMCALALCHCGSDDRENSPVGTADTKTASVALRLSHTAVPLTDSIVVDCYGADTLHMKLGAKETGFNLDLFPHDHWKFVAKLYANGSLMQKGEVETKLSAGEIANVSIPMHAVVGFIYVEIPLGFGNPTGITSGLLRLQSESDTFEYPMAIEGSTAVFTSDMLPLGVDYAFTLTLRDAAGNAIYSIEDSVHIDENTPVPELQINSLRAKISVSLQLSDGVEMVFPLELPAARRAPAEGDMVISEFLVNPVKSDSTAFDFVEIYNGSNDTLEITGCSIGKSTLPKESAIIESLVLPPREALVLGNDTNPNTPEEYRHTENMPTFLKSNGSTAASIVLHCDGEIMDSVYYGKVDSLHLSAAPLNNSSSTTRSSHLNIGAWDDRENPENWCLGTPTPGIATFCD